MYQLFDDSPGYPMSGYLFSIGPTYLATPPKDTSLQFFSTNYAARIRNQSTPGIAVEIGRFHIIPAGIFFNNIDYSLGYKFFNYTERNEAQFSPPDGSSIQNDLYNAKAKLHAVNLNLNFNAVLQISDYSWLQPTLGIHADYWFAQNYNFGTDTLLRAFTLPSSKLAVQIHAKFAYGYKLTQELFIVPGIEIGLWSLNDLNKPQLKTPLFHKAYIPLIFSIKLLLHRPLNMKNCSIPDDLEDIDLEKKRRSKKKVRLF